MSTFRTVLFWLHLAAGLIAGLVIGIMCITGTMLAFEKELVAWAERDTRQVAVPVNASRLPIAELTRLIQIHHPEATAPAFTIFSAPHRAVVCALSKNHTVYVNPYDGTIHAPTSKRMAKLMRTLRDYHRWLALDGDQRPIGKAITGSANLIFTFLALSGLYLWWPRAWSWRGLKAIAIFNWQLTGKARDFNWHNTIGLWSAPILIVLTVTAVPISYRWGGTLIETLVGHQPPLAKDTSTPKSAAPQASETLPPTNPAPAFDQALAAIHTQHPAWLSINLRANGANLIATIREPNSWPRTATTTLTLRNRDAQIIKREGHADQPAARRVRAWTRFLHTGEALGWLGQLGAGLASLGGGFLVYTGFALSWRRFFRRKAPPIDG